MSGKSVMYHGKHPGLGQLIRLYIRGARSEPTSFSERLFVATIFGHHSAEMPVEDRHSLVVATPVL
jgi:hypothetical protein